MQIGKNAGHAETQQLLIVSFKRPIGALST